MVGPDLRALVAAAPGSGSLTGEDVAHGCSEHPVCGDVVELDIRLDGETIHELKWRAQGCPATYAVAAVAAQALPGASLCEAAGVLRQRLVALGDLAAHERHAEAMLLRALGHAGDDRSTG